ncbi:MAG: DUF2809 domain-containing protein [Acidobacteria bacterium]|nr:DUF2809 domain-containing protein [Acidobacteriota bacterium]
MSRGVRFGQAKPFTASRRFWAILVGFVILAGIASRSLQTGSLLFDKYLGDALYAVMIYGLVRLWANRSRTAAVAAIVMLSLEAFQATGIPASLFQSVPLRTWWTARWE